MRIFKLLSLLVIITSVVLVFLHKYRVANVASPIPQSSLEKQKLVVVPQDWTAVNLSAFSFYAPKEIKAKRIKSIDSEMHEYGNDDIKIIIDLGIYSDDLSTYLNELNYKEDWFEIDHRKAKISTFEVSGNSTNLMDDELKLVAAVHFSNIGQQDGKLTIWANCKGKVEQDLAITMFRSINFR